MKKLITLLCVVLLAGLGNLSAQETKPKSNDMILQKTQPKDKEEKTLQDKNDNTTQAKDDRMMPDISDWPQASRMAVEETTGKYGKPDGYSADEMFWLNKGVWKKICITKKETRHNFPLQHTDMMQSTISYKVPEDKMDELGRFDGSVTFDRTQGTMSARCDKEANNILALNLANDIVTGKKTVEQARESFGAIVKEKMDGGNPEYMQKLTFQPQPEAADPDKSTMQKPTPAAKPTSPTKPTPATGDKKD